MLDERCRACAGVFEVLARRVRGTLYRCYVHVSIFVRRVDGAVAIDPIVVAYVCGFGGRFIYVHSVTFVPYVCVFLIDPGLV